MTLLRPQDRLLLLAAVGPPQRAAAAWREWRRLTTVDGAQWPEARIFPLIAHQLTIAGEPDADLDRLKGVQRHAWAKNMALSADTARATGVLEGLDVPSMVLKGVGLQHAYPAPGLRTMGDSDLLVRRAHARTALAGLRFAGWQLDGAVPIEQADLLVQRHTTAGMTHASRDIDLHWRPLHDLPEGDDALLWARRRRLTLPGGNVWLPDPSHQLLIVLAHGLRAGSGSAVQGLCDAAMILRHDECDAALSAELARAYRRLTPLRAGLAILREAVADERIEQFASAVGALGRPNWRDRVAHRSRSLPPGHASHRLEALSRLGDRAAEHVDGPPIPVPTVPLKRKMRLNDPTIAPLLTDRGWSGVEQWGMWTDGWDARLRFRVDADGPLTVRLNVRAFVGRRGRQHIAVSANGRRVATWRWDGAAPNRVETIHLPADIAQPIELRFHIRHPGAPNDLDRRLLGLGLLWFAVRESDAVPPESPLPA